MGTKERKVVSLSYYADLTPEVSKKISQIYELQNAF